MISVSVDVPDDPPLLVDDPEDVLLDELPEPLDVPVLVTPSVQSGTPGAANTTRPPLMISMSVN
jgi:hypothetical protein